ncbi:MAG: NADH-quinone oxidoreductase subunit NuoE [Rhabdaerophilum calidifontis]
MSVRRLAPDALQPASFAFDEPNRAFVAAQIAKYPPGRQASAVIPLLWQAQKQAGGWLPRAAIEHVAEVLDMPKIRVMEVATFYTMFNLEPVGQHFIQLCGTVPCHCMGAEDLKAVLKTRIGEERQVSADGKFSWLEVECLGACTNAPMVQINDDYFEDLTPETFGRLLDDLAAGRPVKVGPQNGRSKSEPLGGPKTLLEPGLYDGSAVGAWKAAFDARIAAQKAVKEAAARAAAEAAQVAAAQPAPVPAPKPAEPKPAESKPAESRAGQSKSAAPAPAAAAADDAAKPALLSAARDGRPDDLKLIWGVGPKLETMLHRMGVFHFDQIAGWSAANLAWVDQNLEGFRGRAVRDDWIGQAKKLAAGWRPESAVGEKPTK